MTKVMRPSFDCRANSTGRSGPSACQSPIVGRLSGHQIREPHPRHTIIALSDTAPPPIRRRPHTLPAHRSSPVATISYPNRRGLCITVATPACRFSRHLTSRAAELHARTVRGDRLLTATGSSFRMIPRACPPGRARRTRASRCRDHRRDAVTPTSRAHPASAACCFSSYSSFSTSSWGPSTHGWKW